MPAMTLHKDELMVKEFTGPRQELISAVLKASERCRPRQLKETTMAPENRTLLRVDGPRRGIQTMRLLKLAIRKSW